VESERQDAPSTTAKITTGEHGKKETGLKIIPEFINNPRVLDLRLRNEYVNIISVFFRVIPWPLKTIQSLTPI
jgi:hypothetical protein